MCLPSQIIGSTVLDLSYFLQDQLSYTTTRKISQISLHFVVYLVTSLNGLTTSHQVAIAATIYFKLTCLMNHYHLTVQHDGDIFGKF